MKLLFVIVALVVLPVVAAFVPLPARQKAAFLLKDSVRSDAADAVPKTESDSDSCGRIGVTFPGGTQTGR